MKDMKVVIMWLLHDIWINQHELDETWHESNMMWMESLSNHIKLPLGLYKKETIYVYQDLCIETIHEQPNLYKPKIHEQ